MLFFACTWKGNRLENELTTSFISACVLYDKVGGAAGRRPQPGGVLSWPKTAPEQGAQLENLGDLQDFLLDCFGDYYAEI
jgi:hypothetical protein